ncbi:hypothetical protein [uncultured Aquitalea sp.]|uniref:hypothetical protein n=1 Tax=uncultured Aquitalea sp. TaxID=540272 RepID=UPI0025EB597A|nr:hypothetical protein [uncultured Aquitalea sp.]
MWGMVAGQAIGAAGKVMSAPGAGPSSARNSSSSDNSSAQKGVMDGSNWTVNYGNMAQSSPANLMLYAGLALAGLILWRKFGK